MDESCIFTQLHFDIQNLIIMNLNTNEQIKLLPPCKSLFGSEFWRYRVLARTNKTKSKMQSQFPYTIPNGEYNWKHVYLLCQNLLGLFTMGVKKNKTDFIRLGMDMGLGNPKSINRLFQRACRHNNVDIVKLIIDNPMVDVNCDGFRSIVFAVEMNYIDIVKLILSRQDAIIPGMYSCRNWSNRQRFYNIIVISCDLVQYAYNIRHHEILKLFLDDPRYKGDDLGSITYLIKDTFSNEFISDELTSKCVETVMSHRLFDSNGKIDRSRDILQLAIKACERNKPLTLRVLLSYEFRGIKFPTEGLIRTWNEQNRYTYDDECLMVIVSHPMAKLSCPLDWPQLTTTQEANNVRLLCILLDNDFTIKCFSQSCLFKGRDLRIDDIKLLLKNPKIDITDEGKNTILHNLCRRGTSAEHACMKILLSDNRIQLCDIRKAVYIACENNNVGTLSLLKNHPKYDISLDNFSCVIVAMKSYNMPILYVLVEDPKLKDRTIEVKFNASEYAPGSYIMIKNNTLIHSVTKIDNYTTRRKSQHQLSFHPMDRPPRRDIDK